MAWRAQSPTSFHPVSPSTTAMGGSRMSPTNRLTSPPPPSAELAASKSAELERQMGFMFQQLASMKDELKSKFSILSKQVPTPATAKLSTSSSSSYLQASQNASSSLSRAAEHELSSLMATNLPTAAKTAMSPRITATSPSPPESTDHLPSFSLDQPLPVPSSVGAQQERVEQTLQYRDKHQTVTEDRISSAYEGLQTSKRPTSDVSHAVAAMQKRMLQLEQRLNADEKLMHHGQKVMGSLSNVEELRDRLAHHEASVKAVLTDSHSRHLEMEKSVLEGQSMLLQKEEMERQLLEKKLAAHRNEIEQRLASLTDTMSDLSTRVAVCERATTALQKTQDRLDNTVGHEELGASLVSQSVNAHNSERFNMLENDIRYLKRRLGDLFRLISQAVPAGPSSNHDSPKVSFAPQPHYRADEEEFLKFLQHM